MHPRDERRVDKANNGSLRQCCCAGACTENTTSTKPLLTTCSIRSSHYSVHPGAGPPLGLHTVRASTPADNGKGAGNDLRHLLPASTSPPIKFSLFNLGTTDRFLHNFAVLLDVGVKLQYYARQQP